MVDRATLSLLRDLAFSLGGGRAGSGLTVILEVPEVLVALLVLLSVLALVTELYREVGSSLVMVSHLACSIPRGDTAMSSLGDFYREPVPMGEACTGWGEGDMYHDEATHAWIRGCGGL